MSMVWQHSRAGERATPKSAPWGEVGAERYMEADRVEGTRCSCVDRGAGPAAVQSSAARDTPLNRRRVAGLLASAHVKAGCESPPVPYQN